MTHFQNIGLGPAQAEHLSEAGFNVFGAEMKTKKLFGAEKTWKNLDNEYKEVVWSQEQVGEYGERR